MITTTAGGLFIPFHTREERAVVVQTYTFFTL